MNFLITFVNIFLFVLIFYTFFDKINTITEPLDEQTNKKEKCDKNDKDLVYKQEAKITDLFSKLNEVESGLKIIDDKSKKNTKNIKRNSMDLKANSANVQNKADEKMKELDKL